MALCWGVDTEVGDSGTGDTEVGDTGGNGDTVLRGEDKGR